MKDIVDTAVSAGGFNTLVTAVKAAGLVDALKGAGPFTVFAPNDAAFKKLPAGTLDAVLKDKNKLTDILTYHVVPGKMPASDVAKQRSLKTLEGKPLSVDASGGNVMINDARVIQADIMCNNGVIHVIDSVLLPK
ncbi:fasciclin domain-containing protein [Methanocella paludicola]